MQQNYLIDHVITRNWGLLTRYSAIRGRTVNRERTLLFFSGSGGGEVPLLSTQFCPGVTQSPRNWVFPSPMAPSPHFSRISTPWGYRPIQKPHQHPPAPQKAGPHLSHGYPTLLDFLPGPASEQVHTSRFSSGRVHLPFLGSLALSGHHPPSPRHWVLSTHGVAQCGRIPTPTSRAGGSHHPGLSSAPS